ncbi:hypothetical protein BKA67DRAFT_52416 [Truncatella angustata]|uniref:Uncharacterized protein n=1 Tax=Truncatella angustata TaxID=152316 RepID=A0A9P8UYP8_9PEZI|nr:uncharacterized protein BKA67DRAFT_52416 [Truncatella angustata]KAH6660456.1 hypothetical protein BKA67DRAFT_52416 [Truncatella angustata]
MHVSIIGVLPILAAVYGGGSKVDMIMIGSVRMIRVPTSELSMIDSSAKLEDLQSHQLDDDASLVAPASIVAMMACVDTFGVKQCPRQIPRNPFHPMSDNTLSDNPDKGARQTSRCFIVWRQ